MASERFRRDHKHEELDSSQIEFENDFKVRALRKCMNDVLRGTETLPPCMGEDRSRPVPTSADRTVFRNNIRSEARLFHNCLCDIHHATEHCRFNLLLVQQNETVLEGCFDREEIDANTPFFHTSKRSNFTCSLRRSRNIRCRLNDGPAQPKETRFQGILECLSQSLKSMSCPVTTTSSPMLTTPISTTPPMAKMLILIMALVISLLLGVLGTWLGIFCWRKRRRKKSRSLPPLMTRPEHASLPNLYDGDYEEDHIYDIVKADDSPTSNPVPDLLSRVPSLPPMTHRTPKSRVHVEPDKSKAAFNKTEMYEPLLRDITASPDRHNTDPKTPVPGDESSGNDYLPLLPDRNSREIPPTDKVKRVHPYDSVKESEIEIEAQDESITTPKLIDNPVHKTAGNDYFILEPQSSLKPQEPAEGGEREGENTNENRQLNTTPERSSKSGAHRDELSPNDSGFAVSPRKEDDFNHDVVKDIKAEGESDRDSDGYEIPVPEVTPFDIASTYVKTKPHVIAEIKDDSLDV